MCLEAQATPAASGPLVLPRPFIAYAPPPAPRPGPFTCCREPDTAERKASRSAAGSRRRDSKGGGAGEMDPISTFLKCSVESRDSPGPRASVTCCPRSSLRTLRPPSLTLGGAVKLHPQGPHTYFREQARPVTGAGSEW